MKNLATLMSSVNMDYITPPDIGTRARRVLVPRGSGRKLLDPGTNDAAIGSGIIRAHLTADGSDGHDGLSMAWSDADVWWLNPEYGDRIKLWTPKMALWGREVGVPGIGLVPNRSDTKWMQNDIHRTADAWVVLSGRQTFWTPIPIYERDAVPFTNPKHGTRYLRRWNLGATADDLPAPFRKLSDRVAVGPELGSNGKPQAAPFPSMVPFWADPNAFEPSADDEIKALRELVRVAGPSVYGFGDVSAWIDAEQWANEAERMLGSKRFADDLPLRLELFEKLAAAGAQKPDHPIDVRTFAAHFGTLGTLTVARGRHRGVYHPRSA